MQYFDIILFAIVAGILAIRLYRVLGRKSDVVFRQKRDVKNNISVATKTQTVNEQPSSINGEGLDFLINLDPAFSEKSFILGAKKAFKLIIEAFNYDDKKTLRLYLDDNVFRAFEKAIIEREKDGHYIERPIAIEFDEVKIDSVRVEKGQVYVRVLFKSKQKIVVKDMDTENIIGGSAASKKKTDIWEFNREMPSSDPNWKLTYTESG